MISHHHKCVFVHVPKAAGESIERAFFTDLELPLSDYRELLLGSNPDPESGPRSFSHLAASEYVEFEHVSQATFDEYFTFAVVRNPWARVVSIYRYMKIHVPFAHFVEHDLSGSLWDYWYHFVRPRTEFVYDDRGNIIVDRVIRFENLIPEFYEVCDQLGLPRSLPRVNTSGELEQYRYLRVRAQQMRRALRSGDLRRAYYALRPKDSFNHYTDFYNDETRQRVAELYRSDIEAFEYTFR